jgi:hypothetical protein
MQTQYGAQAFPRYRIIGHDNPLEFYTWRDLKAEVLTWTGVESTLRSWFYETYGGSGNYFQEQYDFGLFIDDKLVEVLESLGYGSIE